MVITGKWEDGTPLLAIPNYARMNRVAPPPEYPSDDDPIRSPASKHSFDSKVWI
jgi:hypothetical protein